MAEVGDITVTIRAIDEVTPVLKRIGRYLWWMQYGGAVMVALPILTFVIGWVLGVLLGG